RGPDAPRAHRRAASDFGPALGAGRAVIDPFRGPRQKAPRTRRLRLEFVGTPSKPQPLSWWLMGRWLELGGGAPRPSWSARMVAAAMFVVLIVGVLAVKLAQLQIYDSSTLAGLARANTVHRVVLEADRGIVYDRHGVALVQNTPVSGLQVVPGDLPTDSRERAAELDTLPTLSGQPEDRLESSLAAADPFAPVRAGADLTEAQALAINERLPSLAGASIAQHAVQIGRAHV